MRRLISSLLLGLLVICAQQAALLHEIGHGTGSSAASAKVSLAGNSTQESAPAEDRSYCDKCFQFAHVGGIVLASIPAFLVLATSTIGIPGRVAVAGSADVPSPRSRGPPSNL